MIFISIFYLEIKNIYFIKFDTEINHLFHVIIFNWSVHIRNFDKFPLKLKLFIIIFNNCYFRVEYKNEETIYRYLKLNNFLFQDLFAPLSNNYSFVNLWLRLRR